MSNKRAYNAVVTGAGGGIGRALAVELGHRGSSVLVSDVDLEGADETARMVEAAGGKAHAMRCDVATLSDVQAVQQEAARRFGPTELVVNNAGVVLGGPVDEIPMEDWNWIVGINFWGVIYGCRTFVPGFKEQGFGRILNVSSISGVIAAPEMAPYNMTKAAVVALSETLASELAPWNITTTVLCPTAVRTGMVDAIKSSNPIHKKVAIKAAAHGKGRNPEDVAAYALVAVDAGKLYAFPHTDGRMMWRVKRFMPRGFAWAVREVRNRGLLEKSVSGGS